MAIANCNYGVKLCHWQVCSIQRQVAFFFLDCMNFFYKHECYAALGGIMRGILLLLQYTV